MWRVTLTSLRAKKLRLITTALAVMLGVAFMAGTLVLTDTLGKTFDGLLANANQGTDAYVRSSNEVTNDAHHGAPSDHRITRPDHLARARRRRRGGLRRGLRTDRRQGRQGARQPRTGRADHRRLVDDRPRAQPVSRRRRHATERAD